MDIISALLIASTATNIFFDPFNVPNVKTAIVSTYEEVFETERKGRGENDEPELESPHFIYVAWAYAYLPINMVVRAASSHEARSIASYFIENINKQIANTDGPFVVVPMSENEPSNNVDLHNFLAQRGNDGPLFMLSRDVVQNMV